MSIHKAAWPGAADFHGIDAPQAADSFDVAVACITELRKYKTEHGLSMARELEHVTLAGHPNTLAISQRVLGDVLAAIHVNAYALEPDPAMSENTFVVRDAAIAPQPE